MKSRFRRHKWSASDFCCGRQWSIEFKSKENAFASAIARACKWQEEFGVREVFNHRRTGDDKKDRCQLRASNVPPQIAGSEYCRGNRFRFRRFALFLEVVFTGSEGDIP